MNIIVRESEEEHFNWPVLRCEEGAGKGREGIFDLLFVL